MSLNGNSPKLLRLEKVEEKQEIPGRLSGRTIEIDGRGVKEGTPVVILECKRYKDRVEAEKLVRKTVIEHTRG